MKRSIFTILITVILAIMLSACGFDTGKAPADPSAETGNETTQVKDNQDTNKETKVMMNLYFANNDNSAVPIEKREVVVKDGAAMKAAIEALLEGPVDKALRKTIPEGTTLLDINLKDKVAIVNFSKEFTQVGGSVAEIVERISVVNTLTEFEGVQKVKILIDSKDLIGPSGMPFGEMEKFKLDEKGFPIPEEMKTITLYFGNSNADAVAAEKREVAVNQGETLEAVVFRELMNGPATEGLYPTIPEGTKLLSVETKAGICTLNLSQEFIDKAIGGSAGESMTINSIVASLTEIPGVEKVQFMINGEIRDVYLHLEFSEPFSRNESMIQK